MALSEQNSLPALESWLNRATNPANRDEDWEDVMGFCDQVNKELEGPQIAVRLIAHKMQSPQEKEALYALMALEACVKNCGRRFHQEIGKFRFLNEIIKVVSPKYYGGRTSERVKKKCIELLYSWTQGLNQETKIIEAYKMLKSQGIIKQDPIYIDKTFEPPPPPRPKNAIFEDDEKSTLLARLLKSKNPEDLQAANRLIKSMVREDTSRMERVTRRINELETINNNVKVLSEMLQHYDSNSSKEEDKDMMKELYETLEKHRPNLFRLASDVEEKDSNGITEILEVNDTVMRVMNQYKEQVEKITAEGADQSLLDLNFDSPGREEMEGKSSQEILDKQLAALGLSDSNGVVINQNNHLEDLSDIFANYTQASNTLSTNPGLIPSTHPEPVPLLHTGQSYAPSNHTFPVSQAVSQPPAYQPFIASTIRAPYASTIRAPPHTSAIGAQHASTQNSVDLLGMLSGSGIFSGTSPTHKPCRSPAAPVSPQPSALDDLDILGKELFSQTGATTTSSSPGKSSSSSLSEQVLIDSSSSQMENKSQNNVTEQTLTEKLSNNVTPSSQESTGTPNVSTRAPTNQPSSASSTPSGTPKHAHPVPPLTDVFVPLDSIKPGMEEALCIYEKNKLKIVLHFGQDHPREDVQVMAVSVTSTCTAPISNFMFQAMVPKMMKVKLQPPSSMDLPVYNPIFPTSAITQVLLIAHPKDEKICLKFRISYTLDEESCTDVGEVFNFPDL